MRSMTLQKAPASTPDVSQLSSDSEDYDSPTRAESALVLLGAAVIAVPAGLLGMALVPAVLAVRGIRRLARPAK